MIDLIKSTSVPTLDENSEELQKKLEEIQENGTETIETEEVPKNGTETIETEEVPKNGTETIEIEEILENRNETEPVSEEVSDGENTTEPVAEKVGEEEIVGEENSDEESVETTTGSAIGFDIFSNITQKPGLLAALFVVLAVLAALIYSSLKKKDKKEVAGESMENSEMEERAVGITEQGNEMVSTGVFPFTVGKLHEIGAREDQQDSFGTSDLSDVVTYQKKGFLSVVADGMGGLSNGGAVSSAAVCTCLDVFYSMPEHKSTPDMLLEMAAACNNRINQMLNGQRSGSTLVSAIVRDGYLYFLTIGDSHIYLYRNGNLILLNREHIYKEELALQVINGMLSADRANYDAQAKSLTSYLGAGKITHLDRNQEGIKLLPKDRIILASDGVFGTLTPEQMEEALKLPVAESAVKMRDKIEEIGKKHQDNYTALILEYLG